MSAVPNDERAPALAPATFEGVYQACYGRLTRVAHLITGSNEVAEEVVQDAFVALYPRFPAVANAEGYLYTAVVNGCRVWLRRRRIGLRRVPPPEREAGAGTPELDETWAALAGLSPHQRAVVVLRFYDDLSLPQIATVLGCPTGTVKSHLHRGLSRLKEVIER
jgi:RNA polymerase sigma-70 factor (sigma-E family)